MHVSDLSITLTLWWRNGYVLSQGIVCGVAIHDVKHCEQHICDESNPVEDGQSWCESVHALNTGFNIRSQLQNAVIMIFSEIWTEWARTYKMLCLGWLQCTYLLSLSEVYHCPHGELVTSVPKPRNETRHRCDITWLELPVIPSACCVWTISSMNADLRCKWLWIEALLWCHRLIMMISWFSIPFSDKTCKTRQLYQHLQQTKMWDTTTERKQSMYLRWILFRL